MRWFGWMRCFDGDDVKEVHYTEFDMDQWFWPNFTPKEIACKGTGLIIVDEHSMDCLQRFRDITGVPFSPNSAYRSKAHNKAVGGSPNSQHLYGRAFDIPLSAKLTREMVHKAAKQAGFTGIGDYNTFVHVDTGPARYWDMRK